MSDLELLCPKCHSPNLATVEDIAGAAHGGAWEQDGERTFEHSGWTEVWWDSSTSVGVECRDCGWEQQAPRGEVALSELVTAEEVKMAEALGLDVQTFVEEQQARALRSAYEVAAKGGPVGALFQQAADQVAKDQPTEREDDEH